LSVVVVLLAIVAALLVGVLPNILKAGSKVVHIRGFTTILAVDVAQVEKVIPSALTLAPQKISPEGKHPVVVIFQHLDQEQPLKSWAAGWPFPFTYYEIIIAVPYTQQPGVSKNETYWFNSGMYVDTLWPARFGLFLGFTKHTSKINADEKDTTSKYTVFDPSDDTKAIIEGAFSVTSKTAVPFETAKRALKTTLLMTWITETIKNHVFTLTFWNWGLDSGKTKVYPVQAEISLEWPAADMLAPLNGVYRSTPLGEDNSCGSFWFDGSWTSYQDMHVV